MADSAVNITAGAGTPIRVLTALGPGSADQQVVTLADSAGNLLGTSAAPFPTTTISSPDQAASGTITATDIVVAAPGGAGVMVSGTPTAGSTVVALMTGGMAAWVVEVTGQTTGNIWFEVSADSTDGVNGQWINVLGRQTGNTTTVLAGSMTAGGYYRGNVAGAKYFRVRQTGTLTGTPAVVLRFSAANGAVFLNASLPAGTNTIGAVTGTGTAGTPATGVQTVQGIAGGTAQPVSGTFWQATQPVSGTFFQATQPVSGTFWQATQPVSLATNTPDVTDRAARLVGITSLRASDLIVSTTGAAAAAVTATLPAAGAGLFHYITRVNILKYASVATVGAAAPTVVTSTNLAGSLAWSTPTAQAVGTQYETDLQPAGPIKSAVANTATTIVCPATTSIIWRVNVYYYTAA